MAMSDPPPIRHRSNPNIGPQDVDFDYVNPLSASGSDFPCKGHLDALSSPAGNPVATWQAGQQYSLTITGGAPHGGGSCQASLSYDGGRTFKAIHSWIGSCPGLEGDSTWTFSVPHDAPSADRVIFAWSWFNKVGNREMYMNCAVVSITGGGGRRDGLSSRPDMFVANVGNGCTTVDSRDVMLPNPGPDVDVANPDAVPPTGSGCDVGPGAVASAGSSGSETGPGSNKEDYDVKENHENKQPQGSDEGQGKEEETGNDGMARNGEYAPGNDWPVWFSGGGEPSLRTHSTLLLWSVMALGFFFHQAWLLELGMYDSLEVEE
ncbi:hypothetical protein ACRALDRAFT_2107680 [Sodiomyces alcalophilus JCM 7366]|uniref:uncharacterized protein n=1 Tax=Sodiomyces alcalophilus JCM 7366 TaxID=591952 RepID=UPI0039B42905